MRRRLEITVDSDKQGVIGSEECRNISLSGSSLAPCQPHTPQVEA